RWIPRTSTKRQAGPHSRILRPESPGYRPTPSKDTNRRLPTRQMKRPKRSKPPRSRSRRTPQPTAKTSTGSEPVPQSGPRSGVMRRKDLQALFDADPGSPTQHLLRPPLIEPVSGRELLGEEARQRRFVVMIAQPPHLLDQRSGRQRRSHGNSQFRLR